MKLIVGLGNPGRAYEGTRHNVGFDVLEKLAERAGSPSRKARFQGEVAQISVRGTSALLLWPLTWMAAGGPRSGFLEPGATRHSCTVTLQSMQRSPCRNLAELRSS